MAGTNLELSSLPLEEQIQLSQLGRRQSIADALLKQAMTRPGVQMAGPVALPNQGQKLERVVAALMQGGMQDRISRDQLGLAQQFQANESTAIQGFMSKLESAPDDETKRAYLAMGLADPRIKPIATELLKGMMTQKDILLEKGRNDRSQAGLEVRREGIEASRENAEANRGLRIQLAKDAQELRYALADMADRRARDLAKFREDERRARQEDQQRDAADRADTIQAFKFRQDLEKIDQPGTRAAMDNLNKILLGYEGLGKKGIPGTGYGSNKWWGQMFMGPEGKVVSQAVAEVGNQLARMYAGLSQTGNETARQELEQLRTLVNSPEDFVKAWPNIVKRFNAVQASMAAVSPKVKARYQEYGGPSLEPIDPAFKDYPASLVPSTIPPDQVKNIREVP